MLHFVGICFLSTTTTSFILLLIVISFLIAVTIHDFLTEFLLVTILGRPLCIQVKSTR